MKMAHYQRLWVAFVKKTYTFYNVDGSEDWTPPRKAPSQKGNQPHVMVMSDRNLALGTNIQKHIRNLFIIL